MDEREGKYRLALTLVKGVGTRTFFKLLKRFGSAGKVFSLTLDDLEKDFGENFAESFVSERKKVDVDNEWEKVQRVGVTVLCHGEEVYPRLLSQIYDPPPVLYVKGDLKQQDLRYPIAVVGTRKPSSYGRKVTGEIVSQLSSLGFTVVSGMAFGIDLEAHKEAINSGGKTIAVLASGADVPSPLSNKRIYDRILSSGGCVVSEMPVGQPPSDPGIFPMRNRIISGLTLGTLVVEAGEKSGALITARSALEQNREVFAIPSNIDSPLGKGTNGLIKMGSGKLVQNVEDILDEFGFNAKVEDKDEVEPANEMEAKILDAIGLEGKLLDGIVKEAGLTASTVGSKLSVMEIAGKVYKDEQGRYWIKR